MNIVFFFPKKKKRLSKSVRFTKHENFFREVYSFFFSKKQVAQISLLKLHLYFYFFLPVVHTCVFILLSIARNKNNQNDIIL